jgi:hypothetical protein
MARYTINGIGTINGVHQYRDGTPWADLAAALPQLRLGGLNASTSSSAGLIIRCTKNGGITELGVRLTQGLGQNMAKISAVCQL